MSRAAVAFPGRGSYTAGSLRSLPGAHPWVRRAEELRSTAGLPSLVEIDSAEAFHPAIHQRASNAWPLTFLCSLLDAERIADDHEVVVVVASSTGWYTALAASGVLGFDDAFRLVQQMALAAEEPLPDGASGAELIYPLTNDAWQTDPARSAAIDAALATGTDDAGRALELGSFAVVGGTRDAVQRVASQLPEVMLGGRSFPLRLAGDDAWHTALRARSAAAAAERLGSLSWDRPNVTLVDGRGARFTPWSTDPEALAEQTLNGQANAPYDFARGLRVALREYAPDVVVLPGPGTSLGASCAQLIVAEGYRSLRSRAEFETAQAGSSPILLSMRR
ncbi:ACP S-malonyltransferase [soil metagenome]